MKVHTLMWSGVLGHGWILPHRSLSISSAVHIRAPMTSQTSKAWLYRSPCLGSCVTAHLEAATVSAWWHPKGGMPLCTSELLPLRNNTIKYLDRSGREVLEAQRLGCSRSYQATHFILVKISDSMYGHAVSGRHHPSNPGI